MRDFEGIIFDMDGVIFDTERIGLESWLIVGDKYGLENVTETAKSCTGRSTADSMKILEATYGDIIDVHKLHPEVKRVFNSLIEERGLPVKKGAREILGWINDMDIPVGLASSTAYDVVTEQLTNAGLIGNFKIIVGGDMVEHSKPQPEIYLLACEKLGVEPCGTYAVEDSYNGILSAYRAKMMPILVPDLIEPNDEMLRCSEEKFDDLFGFMEYLKKHIN